MYLSRLRNAALCFALAGLAQAADTMPPGVQTQKSESGKEVLADSKGMTLYTFDKDSDGKSACNAKCAANWPPLAAEGESKAVEGWTVITRDDGSKQWAHNGKPLYTWVKDKKAGDVTGDGVGGVWHIATP